jgi:hypothetical protein
MISVVIYIFLVFLALIGLRLLANRRIVFGVLWIFLALTGGLLTASPTIANTLANLAGVGRGADLIFYIFLCFATGSILLLTGRLRTLEKQLIDLARWAALSRVSEDVNNHSGNQSP